jgi:hypothetical protein
MTRIVPLEGSIKVDVNSSLFKIPDNIPLWQKALLNLILVLKKINLIK